MFQYFPTNYVWSLAVAGALEAGAKIGEIEEICGSLRKAAEQGDDAGTEAFFAAWVVMGDKLIALARADLEAGRELSAGEKLDRAALYFITAERMQAHDFAPRHALYRKMLDTFAQAQRLLRSNCTRIEIPYRDVHLAGLLVRARGASADSRPPLLVMLNGLDCTKEMLYPNPFTRQITERGVSVLYLDQPGSGEALRLHDLPAVADTEAWASVVVDYLETRADVDPQRIGLAGVSLGGYYCPRAVACEPRFALGAVWGANHDWGEIQLRRRQREGENPVPHYWQHVMWVWDAQNVDDFMRKAASVTLEGVLDRVKVPFLVTHGANDRQIPLSYAHRTYEQLVNSPDRELKIFTSETGGVEHVSLDNMSNAGAYIADWIAERLGGRTTAA
ncbi:alpha/beta hydrolase family protein [Paraburkholderia sp.]|uniref:alpha/beta hydrolase family protein n=1 Tax=Paraburkholderia sp. TaxID=1926495 RepID=UPI0039E4AD08